MKLTRKVCIAAIFGVTSVGAPILMAQPSWASGLCGGYGSFNAGGGTTYRTAGNCNNVGSQAVYSDDGIHMFNANPGYGYYSATSSFNTGFYYGVRGHFHNGTIWEYNTY